MSNQQDIKNLDNIISYFTSHFIKSNIELKNKNWFKTGGNAKFYCEPNNNFEFSQAVNFANKLNLSIFVLGEGANILISDDGFDGLVIRPQLLEIDIVEEDTNFAYIKAGSGIKFQNLIDWCLGNNFSGLEEFSGIPGTVGGAVYINIHYFEFLLDQFLVSAEVINKETGEILTVDKSWFNFGYDYSTLHKKSFYLFSATFKLKKKDSLYIAYAKGRRDEIIRHRLKRYPTSGTCGSFFRNFLLEEINFEILGQKIIFVGYYLDKIGVKGSLSVGDATVSYKHANMLVNKNNAKSIDIIKLAKQMQELVYKNYNIIPVPECQLIGFKDYPLLTR